MKHAQRELGILEHIHISMALNIRADCLYVYSKDFVDCLGSRRVFQTVCLLNKSEDLLHKFYDFSLGFSFGVWDARCSMQWGLGGMGKMGSDFSILMFLCWSKKGV